MIRRNVLILLSLIFLLSSCINRSIVTEDDYIQYIEEGFEASKKLASNRSNELFSSINEPLSKNELLAIKFYYAAMPLSDLADYNGDFFLANVRASLKAREDYSWVKGLPDDIFLHFVLPIRVNNENLDSFRLKYYDELFRRIGSINDIEEAALEINHWCHEKVSYQSADIRTSAPLSTILSARGRCGEESTFTVAALRTVGIPARQVYVPRWAHSDDNHAWVEVWIKGKWKYLGACEPEAVLNRGWFTEAASRAMLVHTLTFGKYFGKENLVKKTNSHSQINNLDLYTDVKELAVFVVDTEGKAIKNASVQFAQLNYSEFFPLATLLTDKYGKCSFHTANGDIMVWASKDNNFAFAKGSPATSDSVKIVLGKDFVLDSTLNIDLLGPEVVRTNPAVSEKLAEINRKRLQQEDSIRQAYISSWISKEETLSFARENGYKPDQISSLIKNSMGNYLEISSFLQMCNTELRDDALALLNIISEKDLRDTRAEVLFDHLVNARKYDVSSYSNDVFVKYILNPRITNEIIVAWRGYIQNLQNQETIEAFRSDPGILVAWMDETLPLKNDLNYYKVPITPVGVLELGLSDTQSRDILYVACCRSCGIPARLEPGTLLPQYLKDGSWNDIYFKDRGGLLPRSASLSFISSENNQDPQYYKHFTIAKLDKGIFNTLKFDYNKKASDFDMPLSLSAGYYMLVTSNRLDDRNILSSIKFFELKQGEQTILDVSYREEIKDLVSIGKINGSGLKDRKGKELLTENLVDKGAIIAWIDHEKEPSKHLLNEMQSLDKEFNSWDGNIIFVIDSEQLSESFDPSSYASLPEKALFAYDMNFDFLKSNIPDISSDISGLPVIIFVDPNSDILYKSDGYQVGYGERLLSLVKSR